MKKKIFSIIAALAVCLSSAFTVYAQKIPDSRLLPRLVDEADLLSDSEESRLLTTLDEISERQNCDVVVVTVDTIGDSTATEFADDFYDYNGYGAGENRDGILLLISMAAVSYTHLTLPTILEV